MITALQIATVTAPTTRGLDRSAPSRGETPHRIPCRDLRCRQLLRQGVKVTLTVRPELRPPPRWGINE